MKRFFLFPFLCAIAALSLFCVACDKSMDAEGDIEDGINAVSDNDSNIFKPLELSTKSASLVNDGFGFTFNFIDQINSATEGDYVVSPLSMQFLLGMILNGAQGETAAEICKVLGYGADGVDDVNEYVSSMLEQLPAMDKQTTLAMANGIFVNAPYPLKDNYKKTVVKYYDAAVANLDFKDNENSLKAINGWCAEHTNDLIPKIIDGVQPDMLAYHLNALYFKSQWKYPFDKKDTALETFTNESGTKKEVSMMKKESLFPYIENDIFKAVKLPYGNGAFSMVVMLPKDGHSVSDITAELCKTDWHNFFTYTMRSSKVNLWLPKFETGSDIQLNEILKTMGMPQSFSETADFKALSDYAAHLAFVKQVATITVDESGAEAAAVSGAGTLVSSMPEEVELHANHPFLYIIAEQSTGAVLFAGRYSGM